MCMTSGRQRAQVNVLKVISGSYSEAERSRIEDAVPQLPLCDSVKAGFVFSVLSILKSELEINGPRRAYYGASTARADREYAIRCAFKQASG